MKKILLLIIVVVVGVIFISNCSKNDILDSYNNVIQSVGQIELTKKTFLQGEKNVGDDDYTGAYKADYESFSNTEYLFGGTSIKRDAGKEVTITCEQTITLSDGRNYFGIECNKFTGKIELKIE